MSNTKEVGYVKNIRDFLVYIDGLPTIKINEIVENEAGLRGIVHALLEAEAEILLLDEGEVQPNQLFTRLGKKLNIPVGDFLLGRAINSLGVPIDGRGLLAQSSSAPLSDLDKIAPGINHREFINQQFITGIGLIDTLIPIGKGQRELVIGDARSGKTDFLIDIIVNQRFTQTICIYASIGKPMTEVRSVYDQLKSSGALKYTAMIAAASSDPAPLIFLTPKVAMAVAEYFQSKGRDVLLILDDMGNHAKIYREISLLGNRSPGRESYPGDIFYQQAFLVERAGNFIPEAGGGSITCLPVIELDLNDFTAFIPTNLMAMTDGHLLFKSSLSIQGFRPAIDIGLSVSRVGQQTQARIQNLLATRIKQVLSQAINLETISRFSSELPESTRLILNQKIILDELLKQPSLTFLSLEIQIILLGLVFTSFFKGKSRNFIRVNKGALIGQFSEDGPFSKITESCFSFKSDTELIDHLESLTPKLNELLNQKSSEKTAIKT